MIRKSNISVCEIEKKEVLHVSKQADIHIISELAHLAKSNHHKLRPARI